MTAVDSTYCIGTLLQNVSHVCTVSVGKVWLWSPPGKVKLFMTQISQQAQSILDTRTTHAVSKQHTHLQTCHFTCQCITDIKRTIKVFIFISSDSWSTAVLQMAQTLSAQKVAANSSPLLTCNTPTLVLSAIVAFFEPQNVGNSRHLVWPF